MAIEQDRHKSRSLSILVPAAVLVAAVVLFTTAQMMLPERLGDTGAFLDFHVFYLVGQLGLEGEIGSAYHAREFLPVQAARPGYSDYFPYSYPPHASMFTMAIAVLPDWAAYLMFCAGTALALAIVLWRLAPAFAADAILLVMPSIFIAMRSGQNGCLTAALIGLACLWWHRRAASGLPLGLLTYKPHVALGLGLAVLLKLRLRVAVMALLVMAGLLGVATLVFGVEVWSDFLNGVRETTQFLDEGLFPFHRMASVYGLMRTLGLSAEMALTVHLVPAGAGVILVGLACLGGWDPRRMLALCVMAGFLISPYLYDYDLIGAAVAIALARPEMLAVPARLRALFNAGILLAGSWGLVEGWFHSQGVSLPYALGGAGLLVAFSVFAVVLVQAERLHSRKDAHA